MSLKRFDEAIELLENLVKMSNGQQHAINTLIWTHANAGNMEKARLLMNELKERSATEYIGGANLGISAAYLGDLDTAIEYLEKAFDEYDLQLYVLSHSPVVPTALRNDLRFQHLFHRMKLPM
jgi:tetratricopeptide (TPR) repeat protein